MINTIIKLIMCHLIGDYVLQSDFIGTTKGQNWYHLFVHCGTYIVPFAVCFGFNWQLAIVFIVHFIIDPLKARYKILPYWLDQVIHYLTLLIYLV